MDSKKILGLVKDIIVWCVMTVAVIMMVFTIVSVSTFDRADRSLFGYKVFVVMSDSMSATDFDAGDLIFVRETDPAELKPGDIVSYLSTNTENYGAIVTHKIRRITTDDNGNPGFVTYGTTTDTDDANVVTYDRIIGQYKAKLPGVGHFFRFLKTTPGYIVCIFLPFLILIFVQGINSIKLFQKYKREQLAEMESEREKQKLEMDEERSRIEAERLESQKMMQEILKLRKELESAKSSAVNQPSPRSSEENDVSSVSGIDSDI